MSYALMIVRRLNLEEFATASGLHPDLIRRLVALGLIDAERDAAGDLYAEARIMVPARLSRAERRLFEQLAAESDFDPRKQR